MARLQNLFSQIPDMIPEEIFETILEGKNYKLERIISSGHTTPEGQWYDQESEEWVVLLRGEAALRFEEEKETLVMKPGDYLNIPAHCRHRVEWTKPETVWLALHYKNE